MLAQIKKIGLLLPVLFLFALPAHAQLGTIQGFCDNGGNHSLTSGLPSSNYLQGDIPLCTVSVFYHDTTTLAPIFMGESSTGTLNSVQVTAGGSYSVCPTGVSFSGGGGSGATATVSCTAGAVVSVAVTSPGSGYTTAPTVSFTGGTGSGATAVATIIGDLTNPFQANTDGSWRVWAAIATGYDITMSGGIPPNAYAQPRTITNIFPNAFGGTSYTIVQANGTASAPVSPVNFINSDTVNFSITGNQISAAVNAGSTLALEHNSSATGILQTLLNLCDNGSCGPALDSGMQQVYAKTGTNDGSWVLETASLVTGLQPFITYPISGNAQILYPLAEGVANSCDFRTICSPVANANYPASIERTASAAGSGAEIDWTGVQSLPSSIPASSVTAVYGCWLGWATAGLSGNNGERTVWANSNTITPNTASPIGYGTYCAEIASGSAAQTFDYATAIFKMQDGSSTFYTATSYFFMQPFLLAYSPDAPEQGSPTSIVVDQPLQISGNHLQLPAGWRAVFDTGSSGAAYAGTSSSYTSPILPGTEIDLIPFRNNTSTTPTFNLNSSGAVTIVKGSGSVLALGDMVAGYPAVLKMDSAGTLVLENPVTGSAGGGTVTSVAMTVPAWLSVGGSPITSSGTLAVTAATGQTQNEVLASPNGSSGALTVRALVNADLPTSGVTAGSYTNVNATVNSQGVITSMSNGSAGSGLPSCTSGQMVYYASSGTMGTCLNVGTGLSIASSTLNATGGGGLNGTVTYTSSQTASSSDNGKLVVMNCSSACAYTLPATQPSTTWNAWVVSMGSTLATIALGGSDTFNGSASVPVLNSYRILSVWANTATSTDYRGDAPLVVGSGLTGTPAANGFTLAANGACPPGAQCITNTGSDIGAQINSAATALGSAGGIIYIAPGAYPMSTNANVTQPNISIIGAGSKASILSCTVSGDCLTYTMPAFVAQKGPTIKGFTINANSTSSAIPLHVKDLIGSTIYDVVLENSGSTSPCMEAENVASFTEENQWDFTAEIGCFASLEMFQDSGDADTSFGYNKIRFQTNPVSGHYGLYIPSASSSCQLYNGSLDLYGDMATGSTLIYNHACSNNSPFGPENINVNTEGTGGQLWDTNQNFSWTTSSGIFGPSSATQGTAYSATFVQYAIGGSDAGFTDYQSALTSFPGRTPATTLCPLATTQFDICGLLVGQSAASNDTAYFSFSFNGGGAGDSSFGIGIDGSNPSIQSDKSGNVSLGLATGSVSLSVTALKSATGFHSNSSGALAADASGTATLSSGTVTVSNAAACTPSSTCVYILTHCGVGSSTAIGTLSTGTITAGTSFVINSLTSANVVATGDLSTVCWSIK